MPRLSVDIDLNYVGSGDRATMLADKPNVEQAVQAVCAREGLTVKRMPSEHAGGKWRLSFVNTAGSTDKLEVDLNFMLRVPLWPVITLDSKRLGPAEAKEIVVVDRHELAAGKLAALCSRNASRDIFDARELLRRGDIGRGKLRLAFVVYGGLNRRDWRTVRIDDIAADALGRATLQASHMTFHSTRWSLVSAAARWKPGEENDPAARDALEMLCAAYFKPLHAYARRRADSEENARDLLQSFFVHVLEKGVFAAPQPDRGRFRAFLTASLRNFITNEVRSGRASKRGGGARVLSLESALASEGTLRLADLASHDDTPERAFDRAWALAVLERALERLAREQESAGKAAAFRRLRPLLTQQAAEPPLRVLAEEFGTTEGALKVALHRLRQRYGELLREEVAGTLSDPAEVDDELRALFAALAP